MTKALKCQYPYLSAYEAPPLPKSDFPTFKNRVDEDAVFCPKAGLAHFLAANFGLFLAAGNS
jgi:hypothetical protein